MKHSKDTENYYRWQEQLHKDGFDKWHDTSVVGMLSTTHHDDNSDDDKVDSHEAVERFFAQPKKPDFKKKDIMAGLFHNALQMTQNKNRHVAPKRTSTVGTKHNRVKITPVHELHGGKAAVTEPYRGVLHKYKKGHRHSKLDKIEAKQRMLIANEMKKPLDEDDSKDHLPLTIVHHSSSSASAAAAAVHAAAKAVGTLKALKASADRGVTRANQHLKALRSQESPNTSIMREAKRSAKKTLARLQEKEAEQRKATVHKHEAKKEKLVVPMQGIQTLTSLTAKFLDHPAPQKVKDNLHPLPKSWTTSEDLTIEPEDKVATVKQLVGDTLDIEDFP